MLTKLMLLGISVFSLFRNEIDRSEDIKEAIRTEVSAILFKLLIGVVLASIVIFSIVQLGILAQSMLNQIQNGYIVEIICFSVVAIISSCLLYLLFNGNVPMAVVKKTKDQPTDDSFNFQAIAIKFAEGIVEGFEARNRSRQIDVSRITSDSRH